MVQPELLDVVGSLPTVHPGLHADHNAVGLKFGSDPQPISSLFSRDGREIESDSAGAYLCRRSLVADGACRTIRLDQSPHPISNQRSRQDRC